MYMDRLNPIFNLLGCKNYANILCINTHARIPLQLHYYLQTCRHTNRLMSYDIKYVQICESSGTSVFIICSNEHSAQSYR